MLTQLKPTPISRNLNEITQRMELKKTKVDVFLISDFQKSTIGNLNQQSLDTLNQWHVLPIELANNSNVFVDSVYLENPFMIGGEKNSIVLRIQNSGTKAIEDLIIKLTINNVQAATSSIDIEANSITETKFELNTSLQKLNQIKISFNDYPISFDNEFYFALNYTNKINVVEIKSPLSSSYI